jgi:hypothetical protein
MKDARMQPSRYSRRMMKTSSTLFGCLLASTVSAALADDHFTYTTPKDHPAAAAIAKAGGCAPKDNTARILKSPHPLDLAPNWTGTNYIGTGWTFMPKRYVVDPDLTGGIYLEGNLITTRGATIPDDLYILYAEWDCAGK